MKYIKLVHLGKNNNMNRAFALVVEGDDILHKDELNYSEESTKEEIASHLSEVSGLDIVDFSMSFDWVGGRPNDRK